MSDDYGNYDDADNGYGVYGGYGAGDDDGGYDYEEDKGDDAFEDEMGAYNRADLAGEQLNQVLKDITVQELNEKGGRAKLSPEDRFVLFVSSIAASLKEGQNGDKKIQIGSEDIKIMLTKSEQVESIRFKNPVAYILGYVASEGGKKMEEKRVKKLIQDTSDLGPVKQYGVTGPDIIRYGRYWMLHLSK